MKRVLIAAALALAPTLALAQPPQEIPYEGADALSPPADMHLGEVAGVAFDAKSNHLFVFQRGNTTGPAYGAAAAQLLEFTRDGKFVREIGHNLYAWSFAHAVRVDPQGNIWAADKGSDMVIRFNPQGRVTWVFGRKPEASDENAHPLEHPKPPLPAVDGQFRQVTDMAWDSKGNTYVSDGYINSRVAKIGPDGQWLKSWGSYGKEPGQFDTLHSIAVDAEDRVYVADRGNRRIQVFDRNGKFLRFLFLNAPYDKSHHPTLGGLPKDVSTRPDETMPWAICISNTPTQYLYAIDDEPGRLYKMTLDGKILGMLGISGRQKGQFNWPHAIACPSENTIFIADMNNWRLQKLTLHPERAAPAK
jgi:hypothetical protein